MNLEKRFDRFAVELEKSTLKSGYKTHKIIPSELLKLVDKGSIILDIGVGTGLSSRIFVKKKFEVTGIDFSKELLKIASRYNYKKLIKQDISKKLKVKKNYFDAVISLGVFDFFRNLNQIFKEVKRVLKKEGYFSFTVIKNQKPAKSEDTFKHSKKEIRNLAKRYGFKIIKELEFLGYKRKNYFAVYYGFILQEQGASC